MVMDKVRSMGSILRGGSQNRLNRNNDDIVKEGYLTKLKTNKLRYFVLRHERGELPARLEYYYSQQKFLDNATPKKQYILKDCFSISKNEYQQNDYIIAIYIKKDCISLAAKTEHELEEWLRALKQHKPSDDSSVDSSSRMEYEHVWQVDVQPRRVPYARHLSGPQRVCLTNKSLSLVRVDDYNSRHKIELNTIRRCGSLGAFFFIELGRYASTGSGILWMTTEDPFIAQNMHANVARAMESYNSSPREQQEESPMNSGSSEQGRRERTYSVSLNTNVCSVPGRNSRDRCDSMPVCRPRTTSESAVHPLMSSGSDTRPPANPMSFPGALSPRPQSIPGSTDSVGSSSEGEEPKVLLTPESVPDLPHLPLGVEDESSYVPMENPYFSGLQSQVSGASRFPSNSLVFSSPGLLSMGGGAVEKNLMSPSSNYVPMSTSSELPSGSSNYLLMSPGETPTQDIRPLPTSSSNYLAMSPGEAPGHEDKCGIIPCHGRSSSLGAEGSNSYLPMDHSPLSARASGFVPWPSASSSQMSPVTSISGSHSLMSPPGSGPHSAAHSRSSSLVDDTKNGYLPMHGGSYSGHSHSPYVQMSIGPPSTPTPIPQSPSDGDSFPEMSPSSESSSVTSGTPSSDIRLHDFCGERGLYGNSYLPSEDDDSCQDRPIRTSSVGSKPEQYRSRKNSVPLLGTSPVSHSWSGTTGTFFKGLLQTRRDDHHSDLMEMDFSKNKSCDHIASDEKEKKSSSYEKIRQTLTGGRNRSTSKSSTGSKRDKRASEGDMSARCLEIPASLRNDNNYCEMDFNPSPNSSFSSTDRYLLMKPGFPVPPTSADYMDMRGSFNSCQIPSNVYLDMAGMPKSCGSHDGYVDMTQGDVNGGLIISMAHSPDCMMASSSNMHRCRKLATTQNPMSSLDSLRQDILDPSLGYAEVEKPKKKKSKRRSFKEARRKISESLTLDVGGDTHTKGKSTSPLSTFSNFLTRKNSQNSKMPHSPLGSPLPKSNRGSPSPFSSLTRRKENREVQEMASSLPSLETSIMEAMQENEEDHQRKLSVSAASLVLASTSVTSTSSASGMTSTDTAVISSASIPVTSSGSHSVTSDTHTGAAATSTSRISSGSKSEAVLAAATSVANDSIKNAEINRKKPELKSVDTPDSGIKTHTKVSVSEKLQPSVKTELSETQNANSDSTAYVNMMVGHGHQQPSKADQTRSESLGSSEVGHSEQLEHAEQQGTYVNIRPGDSQAPECSGTATLETAVSEKLILAEVNKQNSSLKMENYSEVFDVARTLASPLPHAGTSSHLYPITSQELLTCPEVPVQLLTGHLETPLHRKKFSLNEGIPPLVTERSRSHSGPGAPEGNALSRDCQGRKHESGKGDIKAASACSSPVSYSPPTSPALGSVSSVSSLSEGGLSSASSTCTVVNVGLARNAQTQPLPSQVHSNQLQQSPQPHLPTQQPYSKESHGVQEDSRCATPGTNTHNVNTANDNSALNYVSLDLGPCRDECVRSSPRGARRGILGSGSEVTEEDEPLSYVQIDFKKSEGLRNTSLARDGHRH